MKRTPLVRKTPLRRTSTMPKTNTERKRWLHEIQFGGGIDHDHYVRERGCALLVLSPHHCIGSIQAAHLSSRGAGGKWFDIVGLCDFAHRWLERGNASDETKASLRSMAKTLVDNHLRAIRAI